MWVTRWYVVRDYNLYIYESETSTEPKRKAFLLDLTVSFRHYLPERSLLDEMQGERSNGHTHIIRTRKQFQRKKDV